LTEVRAARAFSEISPELNLKSFAQVKRDYRRKHPGSIAAANESLRTAPINSNKNAKPHAPAAYRAKTGSSETTSRG
jgi:hypothetical protein